MRFIDRTGQTYGRLTVIELAQRGEGGVKWRCRCTCGNEVVVKTGNLQSGNSQSCGCLSAEKARAQHSQRRGKYSDLTGQRYGRLVIVAFAEVRKGKPYWSCRCDCGAEKVVMAQSLRRGYTRSCGCYHREEVGKRATKHGRHGTAAYKRIYKVRREERQKHLDRNWTRRMEQLLRAFQQACVICGATETLATDHVRPLAKGHGLEPGNATRLCTACNSKKHCKDLHELPAGWQGKLAQAATQFKTYWDNRKERSLSTSA